MADPLAPSSLPANPFDVYTPTPADPFDARRLGHLFRRTAFALTATRLDQFSGKAPGEILDWLFGYDPNDDPLNPLLDQLEGLITPFAKAENAQHWWVYRLLNTPRPFQERIALFWHNHFATSIGKVDSPMRMHQQIDLFRRLGLANFRDLLIAVGRDPAMLVWLDGQANRKGKPNENYGRELMELFTLGLGGGGNYTETDVKQVARAYTGWHIKGEQGVLDPKLFDDGEKEIFGQKGKFNDEGVVDLILAHPACPKHIAWKLLREFVHPTPPQEAIDHYAARLLEHKWEIKPVVREMLSSRLFFSDFAYRSKIKGPCELVTGSVLAMAAMGGKPSIEYTFKDMAVMGQPLMAPPSVKGWDGEEAWINANTLFIRYNFALSVTQLRSREFTRKNDIAGFLEKRNGGGLTTAEQIVDHVSTILLDGQVPSETRDKLLAFLATTNKGKATPFVFGADAVNYKVRALLHLMMTTPEYQLC